MNVKERAEKATNNQVKAIRAYLKEKLDQEGPHVEKELEELRQKWQEINLKNAKELEKAEKKIQAEYELLESILKDVPLEVSLTIENDIIRQTAKKLAEAQV